MLLTRLLVPLLVLSCAWPAIAGTEKESHSTLGGLFFAFLPPDADQVMARFDDKAQVQRLVQHCNMGKAVFDLQAGAKYQCQAEVFKTQPGADDGDVTGVTVQGPARQSDRRQYALFSLAPPTTPLWDVRKIDPDHRTELQAYIQSDTRRFGGLSRQLQWDGARSIQQPHSAPGARTTVVVPGKVVRDAAAFYQAQRHHVFVRGSQGAFSYMGEVPGTPESHVDIDGNDLPGLVVAEGGDGWCISLWRLTGGLRQVGRFGGH